MAKHVKRSVVPIYLVGIVWLTFGCLFSLHSPLDYILCTIISAAVFLLAKALFPDRSYHLPGDAKEEPAPESEPKAEEKKTSTGNPEIDQLIAQRDMAVSEMRRLNDSILDPEISRQIDHLEVVTKKIIDHVAAQPEKLPQIRRFLNYFLPTTLKILNAYDRMDATGISGHNIDATKDRVEEMLGTIVKAFDKQLDALFSAEAMDISADITVMENLLAQEGLGGTRTSKADPDGPTLEL